MAPGRSEHRSRTSFGGAIRDRPCDRSSVRRICCALASFEQRVVCFGAESVAEHEVDLRRRLQLSVIAAVGLVSATTAPRRRARAITGTASRRVISR